MAFRVVALVACVSKKGPGRASAHLLYQSDWFRKASAYARSSADDWYVLSAKYGLVRPDTVIEPYDETLNRMPAAQRRAWAARVVEGLRHLVEPGDRVVILAGKRYREGLMDAIREMGCEVSVPMEGLRIGQQLRWLKCQLEGGHGCRSRARSSEVP